MYIGITWRTSIHEIFIFVDPSCMFHNFLEAMTHKWIYFLKYVECAYESRIPETVVSMTKRMKLSVLISTPVLDTVVLKIYFW